MSNEIAAELPENLEATESTEETTSEESPESAEAELPTKEEVKSMIREFDLKVNGKTIKKKVDLSNEDEIRRELQLSYAGQMAMQKAKELEKASSDIMSKLKNDPWALMQELGINPDEMAENRLRSTVEQMKKSPEQIQHEKIQKELEEARSSSKRHQEELEQIKFDQIKNQELQKFEKDIEEVLSVHKTLPKSQKTVVRIADALMRAWEQGYENYGVKDVIPFVEQEIEQENVDFFNNLPIELYEKYIGKGNFDKLRTERVKNAKKINNLNDIKSTTKVLEEVKKDDRKKMSARDFFRSL